MARLESTKGIAECWGYIPPKYPVRRQNLNTLPTLLFEDRKIYCFLGLRQLYARSVFQGVGPGESFVV